MMQTIQTVHPVGDQLREWRKRRRLSQLDLACEAEISTRHLSFVETGRSVPSRDMILRLAERLDIPLRERNVLLTAAGYAAAYPERRLDDPALQEVRTAVDRVLEGHQPYPALAIDRHWNMISCNPAVRTLIAGAPAHLLVPPVNVLRLSLHPDGLALRIANLAEWRAHLLARLRRQIDAVADPVLIGLLRELSAYHLPGAAAAKPVFHNALAGVAVPFRLRTDGGELTFLSTTTVFGTPVDIPLSELAIETFLPADPPTAHALHRLAASAG